ncbi:MAG TPA: hypothetical protein VLA34_01355 [Candidatus Krumholzibacterium sp.]|nr:hypothetical protein [Candidatus Krumholzibacterium sp.]
MMEDGNETTPKGHGHLFWGTVFVILGILALLRGYLVIAGIPVWAVAFFLLGASHLLKAPRITGVIDPSGGKRESLRRITGVFYVFGMALLAFSVISTLL